MFSWFRRLIRRIRIFVGIFGVEIEFHPPEPTHIQAKENQMGTTAELDGDATIQNDKGSYVIWVKPPLTANPRFVHFSWGGPVDPHSFKVRDYISGKLQQHHGATPQPETGFQISECSMSRDEVWSSALERIPARGELYHNVQHFTWWKKKLKEMTRKKLLSVGTTRKITAAQAILQAMRSLDGECSISQVEHWISDHIGEYWKDISTSMADLTYPGNNSSPYKPEERFLESVHSGVGVYRLRNDWKRT